jgi:hypothetical protein
VKRVIRKIAVLMVMFSGVFLFLNLVITELLRISNTSLTYAISQITAMVMLVVLLLKKKIEVY